MIKEVGREWEHGMRRRAAHLACSTISTDHQLAAVAEIPDHPEPAPNQPGATRGVGALRFGRCAHRSGA